MRRRPKTSWRASLALACAPLVLCAAPAAAQHYAGERALFPYTFGCPAGWSAAEQQGDGLTWCVSPGADGASGAYVGEIRLFPYQSLGCPRDWHKADGTLLPVQPYTTLYALIENTFGGEVQNGNFGMPAVSDAPDSMTWCIALNGSYPQR